VDQIQYHSFNGTLELELRRFIGSIDKTTFLGVIAHIRENLMGGSQGDLVHSRVARFQLHPEVKKHLSQSCASCTGKERLTPKARCVVSNHSGMEISVKVNTASDMWLFIDDGDNGQPFHADILRINREYTGDQLSALFAGCAEEWRSSCRLQLATNAWSTKMEFIIHINPKLVLSYWEGPDSDVGHATLELDFTESTAADNSMYERAYGLFRIIDRNYLDFRSLFPTSLYSTPSSCPIPSPSSNKKWTKHSKVYVPHDQLAQYLCNPSLQQQYAFATKEDGIRTIVRFEAVYNPHPQSPHKLQCIVDCPCPLFGEWGISTYLTKAALTLNVERSAMDIFCTATWIVETRGSRWVIIDFQLPCIGGAYPGISFEHRVTLMVALADLWKMIGEDIRGADGHPIEIYVQRWNSLPPSVSGNESQLGFSDGVLALHRTTEMIFKIKPVASVDLQVIHGNGRYTCNLVTMWGVKVADYTVSLELPRGEIWTTTPQIEMVLEHQQVYEFAVYCDARKYMYLLPVRHRFDRVAGNSIFECVDIFQNTWGRPVVIDLIDGEYQLAVEEGPNFVPQTPPVSPLSDGH
jgi:hypothetical protein